MEIQLNTQQTTTQRMVSADVDGVRYVISTTEQDGRVTYARAAVSVQEEVQRADGQTVISMLYQGTIIYEGGAIQTQQIALEDISRFVAGFTSILAELQKGGSDD
jgi:hypothetical protein